MGDGTLRSSISASRYSARSAQLVSSHHGVFADQGPSHLLHMNTGTESSLCLHSIRKSNRTRRDLAHLDAARPLAGHLSAISRPLSSSGLASCLLARPCDLLWRRRRGGHKGQTGRSDALFGEQPGPKDISPPGDGLHLALPSVHARMV